MCVCVCVCVYDCTPSLVCNGQKTGLANFLFTIIKKTQKAPQVTLMGSQWSAFSGAERGQAPSLSFQWQLNSAHRTQVRQGATHCKPRCHGRSALTSSVGYTHPTMTVSSLWCGSRACLFFGNPLKVALDVRLTKRPQCYYRSTLGWVLIWWVCK